MKRKPDDMTLDEIKEIFQKTYGYTREELDAWSWPDPSYQVDGVGYYTHLHFYAIAQHVALQAGSKEAAGDLLQRLGGGR